jgi:hypothetical protein
MYGNFQGEGCNFFFEENEFFGRVATRDQLPDSPPNNIKMLFDN